jgi:hypothetical protein
MNMLIIFGRSFPKLLLQITISGAGLEENLSPEYLDKL